MTDPLDMLLRLPERYSGVENLKGLLVMCLEVSFACLAVIVCMSRSEEAESCSPNCRSGYRDRLLSALSTDGSGREALLQSESSSKQKRID